MLCKNKKYYITPIFGGDVETIAKEFLAKRTLDTLEQNKYRKMFRHGTLYSSIDFQDIMLAIYRGRYKDNAGFEPAAKIAYLLSGKDFIIRDVHGQVHGYKNEKYLEIKMELTNYNSPNKDFCWLFNNNNNHVGIFFKEAGKNKFELE